MFGQPTFTASDGRAYSQGETLFAQQRITTVSTPVAYDLVRFRSVKHHKL